MISVDKIIYNDILPTDICR